MNEIEKIYIRNSLVSSSVREEESIKMPVLLLVVIVLLSGILGYGIAIWVHG